MIALIIPPITATKSNIAEPLIKNITNKPTIAAIPTRSQSKKERQSRQRELEDYQRQCRPAYSLSQYVELYRLVLQSAQACASQYEEQEQLLFMLNERMTKSITARLALMRQQAQACDDQKRTLDQQFAIVQDDAKKALQEFERVEAQRQETEQQLRIFCDLIQQLQAYLE